MSSADRLLGDSPNRSYAAKLEHFGRFAAPDLQGIFANLDLRSARTALDLGCGTGQATVLLAERLGSGTIVIGADLSLPHLQAARRRHTFPLVQADAARLGFRDESFDLIWICNTLNHLADRVAGLRALRRLLRVEGRLVVAQSGFLSEMYFAWDAPLDDAVRAACHRYYRERYGLAAADLADIRSVVGPMSAAGFGEVVSRTYVLERTQPLSQADRDYFQHTVFEGTWGDKVRPYLGPEDREKLRRNCDPASPDYCLDRSDFHHLQTLTVCEGRRTEPQAFAS